jgi:outer membrane immunogenic protein
LKKILSLCVALTALSFASPVNAADLPVRAPYYKIQPQAAPIFNWSGFYVGGHIGYGFSDDVDGFLGGLQAGYNWQFSPSIVFGVEVDISGTDMNGAPLGLPAHIDYISTARARIGYVWDRTMIYGTGGLAYARASVAGFHDADTGWVAGAGLEWAYTRNWTAKAEYLYHDLGNGFDASTIKLGMNYRFSGF